MRHQSSELERLAGWESAPAGLSNSILKSIDER